MLLIEAIDDVNRAAINNSINSSLCQSVHSELRTTHNQWAPNVKRGRAVVAAVEGKRQTVLEEHTDV